jgi:hypothetical protein
MDDLKQKRNKAIEQELKTVPESRRNLVEKAYAGKASARSAIKAKCMHCVGYEETVVRIKECTVFRCPLWNYRPYGEKDLPVRKELSEELRIKKAQQALKNLSAKRKAAAQD